MSNSYGKTDGLQSNGMKTLGSVKIGSVPSERKRTNGSGNGVVYKDNELSKKFAEARLEEKNFFARLANERLVKVAEEVKVVKKHEKMAEPLPSNVNTANTGKVVTSTSKLASAISDKPIYRNMGGISHQNSCDTRPVIETIKEVEKEVVKYRGGSKLSEEEKEYLAPFKEGRKAAKKAEKAALRTEEHSRKLEELAMKREAEKARLLADTEEYLASLSSQAWQNGSLPVLSDSQALAIREKTGNLYLLTMGSQTPKAIAYDFLCLEAKNDKQAKEALEFLKVKNDNKFTKSLFWSLDKIQVFLDQNGKLGYDISQKMINLAQKGKYIAPKFSNPENFQDFINQVDVIPVQGIAPEPIKRSTVITDPNDSSKIVPIGEQQFETLIAESQEFLDLKNSFIARQPKPKNRSEEAFLHLEASKYARSILTAKANGVEV